MTSINKKMISDAERTVGLNLLGFPKDLGRRALSKSLTGVASPSQSSSTHRSCPLARGSAATGMPRGRRTCLDPLGLGVDVCEADFHVLGPKRHEPPPHHVEAALPSSRIIADHRERVGRRHVPTRRDVRCWPIRRDREDELDLADIGGETGRATHGESIASAGREPKRISASPPPAVTLIPA